MNSYKKNKIFLVLRLPPRLTGATLMNSFVAESNLLKEEFDIKIIKLPHAKTHEEVGKITPGRIGSTLWCSISIFFKIIKFQPKFIYFQLSPLGGAFLRDLIFISAIKLSGKKILYHMHGKGITDVVGNKSILKALYRFAFHKEEVICLTENLTSDLDKVYKGRFHIVPNVIKTELNAIQPKPIAGKLHLLFISNLKISKGLFVFLEVLRKLKQKNVPFAARIVGHESTVTRDELRNKINDMGLSEFDVSYRGPKYNNEKWAEYLWADIMIFPTLNDIWGLVILEAMQAGLPVIASRDGAIPEIIDHDETGFLVEKQDSDTIVEKLKMFWESPDLKIKMGEKARAKYLVEYSFDQFEKKMSQTFNHVISG